MSSYEDLKNAVLDELSLGLKAPIIRTKVERNNISSRYDDTWMQALKGSQDLRDFFLALVSTMKAIGDPKNYDPDTVQGQKELIRIRGQLAGFELPTSKTPSAIKNLADLLEQLSKASVTRS